MIIRNLLLSLLLFYSSLSFSLINPEAPNYVGDFVNKADQYEANIDNRSFSDSEYRHEYHQYEEFLDDELNNAYQLLMAKLLSEESKQKLRESQRAWLAYRDAEFGFLSENFNSWDFGSSSILSKGAYRTTLIRDRVVLLYSYAMNY